MPWGTKSLFPTNCNHSSINISLQFIYLYLFQNPPLLISPISIFCCGFNSLFPRKAGAFFYFLILLPFGCLWVFPFSCITKQYLGLVRKLWSPLFTGKAKIRTDYDRENRMKWCWCLYKKRFIVERLKDLFWAEWYSHKLLLNHLFPWKIVGKVG